MLPILITSTALASVSKQRHQTTPFDRSKETHFTPMTTLPRTHSHISSFSHALRAVSRQRTPSHQHFSSSAARRNYTHCHKRLCRSWARFSHWTMTVKWFLKHYNLSLHHLASPFANLHLYFRLVELVARQCSRQLAHVESFNCGDCQAVIHVSVFRPLRRHCTVFYAETCEKALRNYVESRVWGKDVSTEV